MVYYYNPSILESYGKSVPKTWEEFMETGKILAKDGISMVLSELRFIGMYQQAGGKFFNEDGEFEMDEDLFMNKSSSISNSPSSLKNFPPACWYIPMKRNSDKTIEIPSFAKIFPVSINSSQVFGTDLP